MLEGEPVETIHVYIVKEEEEPPVVDSTAHDPANTATQPLAPQSQQRYSLIAPLLVLAVNIGVVIAVFFVHIYPILTATATITIIPKSKALSATQTLATIQSRVLPSLTVAKTQTVNATGKRHQDATAALGTVTFYNGLFSSQAVPAGTLLTGANGIQIVTDQAALIPPVIQTTPPTDGNATVQAHALFPGAGGNIAARDINAACCGTSVIAQNTVPFQGGQDERDYTVVTQDDIHAVSSLLAPQLQRNMQTALTNQLLPGESLFAPSCSSAVATDHQVGEEAKTLTVTLSQQCKGIAFTTVSLQQEAQKAAAAKVQQLLGAGYGLLGVFHVTPQKIMVTQGKVSVTVFYSGVWVYHLSAHQQQQLMHAIAGKSHQQAIQFLSAQPGVQRVSISGIGKNDALPNDFTHIHVLILYVPR
jgi:hypothetical protein